MTDNDRGRPLDRRSLAPWHGSSEGRPAPHKFLRNKKQEWEEYRSEVTAFELKALLPVL
ncbi:glutamine synthetase [Streptomyces sp. JH14]|uniref:glutamine synthetase n=1 Tax=Streptomyces sp. JH14 TaxID=2793630 RepID=UPI0023F87DAF|nr:glutamine synthetase [Streptomyces sp. JH14]MDF6042098.1 glutamine synthetase [Streptomyces sp. JH14]